MVIDELADLLLGACCPGCRRPGLGLCQACRQSLGCRMAVVEDLPGLPRHLDARVVAVADHVDPMRSLVSAFKDRGAWSLGPVLSAHLAHAAGMLLEPGQPVVLVPVPSSRRAVRERGFDHTQALVRGMARRMPGVNHAQVLRRRGRVEEQSGLARAQRARNQRGSLVARPPAGRPAALLVDDVCTTGATLVEADRALSAAGWQVLGAVVLSHPTRPAGNLSQLP